MSRMRVTSRAATSSRCERTVKTLQRKCFVLQRILSIRNTKQLIVSYKGFSLYSKGFPSYSKLKSSVTLQSILVCNAKKIHWNTKKILCNLRRIAYVIQSMYRFKSAPKQNTSHESSLPPHASPTSIAERGVAFPTRSPRHLIRTTSYLSASS